MTTQKKQPTTSPQKAYAELRKLTINLNHAQDQLALALWEFHEDQALWEAMTYKDMAQAMMVTRQAVQQRVARLIDEGLYVRSSIDYEDPAQEKLFDGIEPEAFRK